MTSHDEGPRISKPSSSSEEPNIRILRGYCGDKELSNPDPLHTGPNAHAEEEETPEDEQRESPSCQEILPTTIMSLATEIVRRKSDIPLKTASQVGVCRKSINLPNPTQPNPTQPAELGRFLRLGGLGWVGLQKNFL